MVLEERKKLLVPRMTTHGFSLLDPLSMSTPELELCCRARGSTMHKRGSPVTLHSKIKVDLIVVGSIVVDRNTGARLGRGEGSADLEYAMLRSMGAIDDSTLVATTVSDQQLVDDLPAEKMEIYDVPVDVICTPTQLIRTNTRISKPTGIYWSRLSPERERDYKIVGELRRLTEEETGRVLKLAPFPPRAHRVPDATEGRVIFISGLNPVISDSDLSEQLKRAGVEAIGVSVYKKIRSRMPCALVAVAQGTDIDEEVRRINRSGALKGWPLRARRDRGSKI